LIASTIRAVIGQRLVRSLDSTKRIAYPPSEEEKKALFEMFNIHTVQDLKIVHELEKQAATQGVGGDAPLSTSEQGILTLYKPGEYDDEIGHHDGFKGRVGIYEVLSNTPAVQKLIIGNATSTQIQAQAIAGGMITMQMDGLIKSLRGVTTVEEILRVTKE
jgi:type IV pilus assembly protein PilB